MYNGIATVKSDSPNDLDAGLVELGLIETFDRFLEEELVRTSMYGQVRNSVVRNNRLPISMLIECLHHCVLDF